MSVIGAFIDAALGRSVYGFTSVSAVPVESPPRGFTRTGKRSPLVIRSHRMRSPGTAGTTTSAVSTPTQQSGSAPVYEQS